MEIFALAEHAELAVAEIYTILSEQFCDDTDLRALFTLLAEEERSHARRVQEVAKAWKRDRDWRPGPNLMRIAELAQKANSVLKRVKAREALTREEAIYVSARLETDFHEVHAQILAGEQAPELRDLFLALSQHDHGHAELFKRLREGTLDCSPAALRRLRGMEEGGDQITKETL